MTSEERHEARYQRRKAKRKKKKDLYNKWYGNYDNIIAFDTLYDAFYLCKRGVSWKGSTQKYEIELTKNIYKTRQEILNGEKITKGFHYFTLKERGKERHIRSVHISERVVQKSVCDNCVLPILRRSFINDNGASLKGKGIDWTKKRLIKHLSDFYKEYKTDGWILLLDFSSYFDNILHEPIFKDLEKKIYDKRVIDLIKQFIIPFGNKSLGLGSEISQVLALNYTNVLDHYIKEVLHIKGYGRYMDDSYLIHHDKQYLKYCLEEIKKICDELGIKINLKKIKLIKLSHSFVYLKVKYKLCKDTGRIIRKTGREFYTRTTRKIRKFRRLVDTGEMTFQDTLQPFRSWQGYLKRTDDWNKKNAINKLYYQTFHNEIIESLLNSVTGFNIPVISQY